MSTQRKVTGLYIYMTMTCDDQQCVILTSVDLDQPLQPPFILRNSKDVQSVA